MLQVCDEVVCPFGEEETTFSMIAQVHANVKVTEDFLVLLKGLGHLFPQSIQLTTSRKVLFVWELTVEKVRDIVHLVVSHSQLADRYEEGSYVRVVKFQEAVEVARVLAKTYLNGPHIASYNSNFCSEALHFLRL